MSDGTGWCTEEIRVTEGNITLPCFPQVRSDLRLVLPWRVGPGSTLNCCLFTCLFSFRIRVVEHLKFRVSQILAIIDV